ncbi:MAG: chromosome segregation protein SMC [Candidatus Aminicenantales bacterium]
MVIKKLEIQGFKSFPERTRIIFHKGITVIVGPNGTGKSNIVDAILWVMGGLRFKGLRGEKIEDVIFHGNQKKAPMGMADVTLSLGENEEKMLINHRVFRSGESEYRLDGKTARLKDIQDALWKRSIAEKEYFIIEQGSIDRILTSKPQEKRQLLEEAAGTAYYRDKKRQAQNKLEQSEQNLTRLEDIIAEVSRAKNSLQRQAAAALRYRKLREDIRGFTLLNFRKKIENLEKSRKETAENYHQSLEEERSLQARIEDEKKELTQKNREVWNLEESIKAHSRRLFNLKAELNHLQSELEASKKSLLFFREKRVEAERNSQELKKRLAQTEEELGRTEKNLEELCGLFEEKKKVLEKTGKENISLLEAKEEKERRVESLRAGYMEKISAELEIKNKAVKTEKELELVSSQEEKYNLRLKEELSNLKKCEQELKSLEKELAAKKEKKLEKEQKLAALNKKKDEIVEKTKILHLKIADRKEEREKCFHHLQALRKVRESRLEEESKKELQGAIGPLAELIESSPQDTPLVDVFWKEEAESTLIPVHDFLRNLEKKDLKGTFLIIHPEKRYELPHHIAEEPDVVGFLKPRLKPKPELKKFLPHLKEAVVVRDIKSALKLWLRYPELNFVTLQGDVLFSSGLMKSGKREEGVIALSQEIKKLEEKIAFQEKTLKPLTQELSAHEEKEKKIKEEITELTRALGENERQITEAEKRIYIKKAEKEKQEQTTSLLHEELRSLNAEKKTLLEFTNSLSSELKTIEEKATETKKELESAEKELAFHQEKNTESGHKFYELKASLELLEEKIRSTEYRTNSLSQRRERTQEEKSRLEEEIQRCTEEEQRLEEARRKFLAQKKELEALKEEIEIKLAGDEALLAEEKKELEDKERVIKKLEKEHEELKEKRVKWEINKAEKDRDHANLEELCWQEMKKTLEEVKSEVSLHELAQENVEEKLEELREKLQKMKEVNLMAEEEYETQKKRYDFLIQQKKDLRSSIDTTQEAIKKIDKESKSQFMKAFEEVNKKFQEVFSLLFKGGKTELQLTEPENPLESGVEIIAQPPGKRLQNMMLLSGGEKALTSLAFLFALFRYRPTPFCILDEVDASLDEANLARFLELMKKLKNQTQFIIVTHNFKTMEVADYIYGTTMAEPSVTSILSLRLEPREKK